MITGRYVEVLHDYEKRVTSFTLSWRVFIAYAVVVYSQLVLHR